MYNRREECPNCGEALVGDGYTEVISCPNKDTLMEGYEPDAEAVYCDYHDIADQIDIFDKESNHG